MAMERERKRETRRSGKGREGKGERVEEGNQFWTETPMCKKEN